MSADNPNPNGPDLKAGVPFADLVDGGMLAGHVGDKPVLLARRGDEVFAIGSVCTHYGAPLAGGLLVGDTVRCPWHHACFSLRTGEALRAPAFDPVACWRVERSGDRIIVREKIATNASPAVAAARQPMPERIVIVGGGAAGFAAAEMLRREGFAGSLTMLSADDAPPCDRPTLSKDYLAGKASESWVWLKPAAFYKEHGIDLQLRTRVTAIDTAARRVTLADGQGAVAFDKLLLATGSVPRRVSIPGADQPHVHTLRSPDDARAIIAAAAQAHRAVVLGASFIGLEVAASLRARGTEVHVVAPDAVPMARILGPEVGLFIRSLHEAHGVVFHLEETATAIDGTRVVLNGGAVLDAGLVVVGVGVDPATEVAGKAGLALDRGVAVNQYLETSAPGILAAGDIARWPDPHSGERIRVEHWVVAERQGQAVARTMLGRREPFEAVPFFWTEQYDFSLGYVGYAERWDTAEIAGQLEARDCTITYRREGRALAVAVIGRYLDGLRAEVEFESRRSAEPTR